MFRKKPVRSGCKPQEVRKVRSGIKLDPAEFSGRSGRGVRVVSGKGNPVVVGIGGSAGSLEALEQFFGRMPPDTGMSFAVVVHIDPTRKDFMPEILRRFTKMPVCVAEDGMKAVANRVSVIPPNKEMLLVRGRLRLSAPSMPRGLRLPIDCFFRSLADDQKERAVGVLLSGMGKDGTQGLKAIKKKRGITLVQSRESSRFDGMPASAIGEGAADFVGLPDELSSRLIACCRGRVRIAAGSPSGAKDDAGVLRNIILLIRARTGHDFSLYKANTLFRRIERRMTTLRLGRLSGYVRFLRETPEEADLLFKELLVGVTGFFRDAEAFDILKREALPALLKGRAERDTIRVWAPGCSTGEEAYSLAIILKECLVARRQNDRIQIRIFATDIDKDAVAKARQGFFSCRAVMGVSPKRLRRFFSKEDSGYRVRKEIREMIVFAAQNIIMDPPFTKLDMLCCRNLLIYLNPELQQQLFTMFCYALKPGGVLFLGASETTGSFRDQFLSVDDAWKIFRKREKTLSPGGVSEILSSAHRSREDGADDKGGRGRIRDSMTGAVAEESTSPAIFIRKNGSLLFSKGPTGRYLEPAGGDADKNAFLMAREGIRSGLISAVRRASTGKGVVFMRNLQVVSRDGLLKLDLSVRRMDAPAMMKGVYMVLFQESAASPSGADPVPAAGRSRHKKKLPKKTAPELTPGREQLPVKNDGTGASRKELRSANEELQSANEDLQSLNEELTTSREEMQSLNEEMETVNAELQNKVEELFHANDDMKNFFNSNEVATIFLDNELKIKRFTAAAVRIVNLIPSDVGRPLSDIVSSLRYDRLDADVREVLKTLDCKELRVRDKQGRCLLMRITPYRTSENVISGVAITFADISEYEKMERMLADAQKRIGQLESDRKG